VFRNIKESPALYCVFARCSAWSSSFSLVRLYQRRSSSSSLRSSGLSWPRLLCPLLGRGVGSTRVETSSSLASRGVSSNPSLSSLTIVSTVGALPLT
jgi:hypothetical protein